MTQAEQIKDLCQKFKSLETKIDKIEAIADQGRGALKIIMWVGGAIVVAVSAGSTIWERMHSGG